MTSDRTQTLAGPGAAGGWRVIVALPAMSASCLLLLFLFGWTGDYDALITMGWLLIGLATLTGRGERIAVRLGPRFHRPSAATLATLAPVWSEVLTRSGIPAGRVHLYVRPSRIANAYAIGNHSVAVTSRLVDDYRAGRIGHQELAGVLCHELGHLATAGVRFGLMISWLSLPWQTAARLVLRLAARLAGGQPRRFLLALTAVVFVIAIVQSTQHHQWGSLTVLCALSVFAVLTPVAEAKLCRVAERAADRYTVELGYGRVLAHALRTSAIGEAHYPQTMAILARHPRLERRIDDLVGTTARPTPPTSATLTR